MRSSRRQVLRVLKNLRKSTEKYLCWILYFIKISGETFATLLLKSDCVYYEFRFSKIPADSCL